MYCEKCGAEIEKRETYKGSFGKHPKYFDKYTGKEITHTYFACPNQTIFGNHTEFYEDNN